MERLSQPLRRERVADAIDCQREMQLLRLDTAATIKATRQTITESHILLAAADTLLTRMP
ncbi:MAG: hypothetical protein JO134_14365 [Xanthobacteraceae bacterium]|nr:hypothetical protein [Xanthobacteraceae bacterium]